MLFVLDGSKALRTAVRSVFGEAPVQRCIRHKERNVIRHLPERDLDHSHPGAAGSLREGMEETPTVLRLRIKGKLKRNLASTKVIGYLQLPSLAVAIERRLHLPHPVTATTPEAAIAVTM